MNNPEMQVLDLNAVFMNNQSFDSGLVRTLTGLSLAA